MMNNDKNVIIAGGCSGAAAKTAQEIMDIQESVMDVQLFSLSINSKTLMDENVESVSSINGIDYFSEQEAEEIKQLLAQAAGIIITRLQEESMKNMQRIVDSVK